jgi:hypothetical protein
MIGLIQNKLTASDFKRLPGHGKPFGLGLADVFRHPCFYLAFPLTLPVASE